VSLRVWLPLTKDLRNQGLDDVTVTNNGATFDANGKLGGCYSFDGSHYFQSNKQIGEGWKEITFACWVYLNEAVLTSGSWYRILGIGAHTRTHLDIASDNTLRLFVSQTGTTSGLGVYSTTIGQAGKWYHLCGVLGNNYMSIYINGLKESERVIDSSSITYTNADYFRVGSITSGNAFNGKISDVRVYDHALSPLEVKEISKGLILHYPLNRNGWGQENLITGYDTSFLRYPDGAVTLFSNQMNGGAQEIVSNIGGATKCLHLHNNGGNGRQYRMLSATSGKSYTISCDYYSTSSQAVPFRGELNGGNYNWAGSNAAAYTTPNKWIRLSFSYLNLTSDATIFYFIQCSQNTDCYIKNLKIEEGFVATPWCPNSSDALAITMGLNDDIEYDASGYGNNGTKVGTTYSSDTPKYNVSTVFDENADTITVGPCYSVGQTIDAMSCAIWFKTNTLNSTAPNLVSLGENSFFRFRLASATSAWYYIRVAGQARGKTFSCKTLTDNVWHHIAIVFDKGYVYSYIDGELIDTEN